VRPTIPLSQWRIALDLEATRAIRPGVPPPCGRKCPQCRNWTASYASVLPPALLSELRRLGIDPAAPTDLYAADQRDPLAYRVMYHVAGRILSGPAPGHTDPVHGRMQWYQRLSATPPWLSLRVFYHDALDVTPGWRTPEMTPLIRIDFRLDVPWVLDEPRPRIEAPPPPKLSPRMWRRSWKRAPTRRQS
jgi:hypothetical protein